MKAMILNILKIDGAQKTWIIRLLVGMVFLSEGIQKFLFPELHGTGRFEKIGLSFPELLGSFVGFFEVLCGVLILLGLFTRLAAILTLIIMLVAIVTTKSMIYLKPGFWELLHGSRTDWSMLLGSLFLIFKGSPAFSLDSFVLSKITSSWK